MYGMLDRLKSETTAVRDGLKSCNRRITDVELSERLLDPRPHAISWFKAQKLETPCDLEDFLNTLFKGLAAKRRVCHRTRVLLLDEESAPLFGLQPNNAYKWIEVLERLPHVFY
jgi:hypothetical protein